MPKHPFHRYLPAAAAALVLLLTACSTGTPAGTPSSAGAGASGTESGLPSSHVHGLSVNQETDQVLLATHEGLFDVTKNPATKIGDTNDLMGFTAGPDQGMFYASGHPGPGSVLPNPLGLIRSTDGGTTWEELSRQAESDFHALTATKSGIVAFDGTLRTTPDGKSWQTVSTVFAPAALAGHPQTDTVLATTPDGIQRSTDAGATWAPVNGPVIQFAAFAGSSEAVGVEPGGAVHYSADGGQTWTPKGVIADQVQAITAVDGADGNPWIWAATTNGLVVSTDGGATFRPSDAA